MNYYSAMSHFRQCQYVKLQTLSLAINPLYLYSECPERIFNSLIFLKIGQYFQRNMENSLIGKKFSQNKIAQVYNLMLNGNNISLSLARSPHLIALRQFARNVEEEQFQENINEILEGYTPQQKNKAIKYCKIVRSPEVNLKQLGQVGVGIQFYCKLWTITMYVISWRQGDAEAPQKLLKHIGMMKNYISSDQRANQRMQQAKQFATGAYKSILLAIHRNKIQNLKDLKLEQLKNIFKKKIELQF